MTDDGSAQEIHYEYQTVKVIRGREASKIAEQNAAGWQLDKQDKGALRTELTFRRETDPPKPIPWKLVGALAAIVVVAIAILAALGVGDSKPANEAKDSASDPATVASSEPVDEPSETPTSTAPEPEEASSAAPSETPTETLPSEAPADEILTVENNADLQALLAAEDDYGLNAAFAKTYAGRKIEFDGNVGAVGPNGGAFDYLILVGDFSETEAGPGPLFQLRKARGLSVGDNIRIVAEVGEFNPTQGLFYLAPVTAQPR